MSAAYVLFLGRFCFFWIIDFHITQMINAEAEEVALALVHSVVVFLQRREGQR
jgi:hypothetical protein